MCRSFSEKLQWKISQNRKKYNNSWIAKDMDKEAPLNVCNFKTKPPDDEWSTPYDTALQNTAFVKKWWELRHMSGFSEKSQRKLSPLVVNYLL